MKPSFGLNNFECFISLSQKMVLTLPLENLQKKPEKCHFQRFTTFGFNLMVISKPFSKTLPMKNFEFKKFLICLPYFPQKTVSTWSLKKLLKIEKCNFEMWRFSSF